MNANVREIIAFCIHQVGIIYIAWLNYDKLIDMLDLFIIYLMSLNAHMGGIIGCVMHDAMTIPQ